MIELLLIDNYDSLTYNLVQALGALGVRPTVYRNDALTVADVEAMDPARIILSPGPCTPAEAGISVEIVRRFAGRRPLLGVCLGHQALAEAFGGAVVRAPEPVHGKIARASHDGEGLFRGLPEPLVVARYHSLVVDRSTLPPCFAVSATCDGLVMGIRHRTLRSVDGVQFHPESFLTPHGPALLDNFLRQPVSGGQT